MSDNYENGGEGAETMSEELSKPEEQSRPNEELAGESTQPDTSETDGGHDDHHHGHEHNELFHVSPVNVLVGVLAVLVVLTVVTWFVATLNLGALGVALALVIATAKSYLVITYFMHMKYDSWANRAYLLTAFVMVGIFFFYAGLDANQYQDRIGERRQQIYQDNYGVDLRTRLDDSGVD